MLRLSVVVLTLFLSINMYAQEVFSINGKIVDENNHAIENAMIVVNGSKIKTNKNGVYQGSVPTRDIYQLTISKQGYFTTVQTFSHFELQQMLAKIADISLVKKAKNRVMLAFGGDVMMGRRYYQPYFGDAVLIHPESKLTDSKAIVQHIKPYMSVADYAAVNLETQIATEKPKQRAPKSVTFFSQPETLAALSWAGIDYVSLGNNHTYDYLDSGLTSTLAYLEESELAYSGAGVDETSALKAHTTRVKQTDFAMLGYVGWEGSANPTQTATHQHGGAAYGSMENIQQSVSKQVDKSHTTIVQYHGSQEYADNPTGVTEQRLKSAIDAGAALAVAHHPHVTQGLELYDGKLIAYSMGNFIFDQNFSATQHSFILYVWLDDGEFHRAEIVPLYVKGYKPTPATGMNRYTVMKRITTLSAQRNTYISQSGGHGVIAPAEQQILAKNADVMSSQHQLLMAENEQVLPLYHLPWLAKIKQVVMPDSQTRYRLGTNLINGSDFESFSLFTSQERGWVFERTATTMNNFGASGQRSLALQIEENSPSLFGMQSFRRVYKPSSAMTIKAKFNVQKPAKVSFYWQGRKKRQKLFDAFKNSPKHFIGSAQLSAKNTWQNVEVNFNSPRIGYKSYRVLAEIQSLDGRSAQVNIDDFALIEWQSAFSKQLEPNFYNTLSYQAAYLGVDQTVSAPVIIKY